MNSRLRIVYLEDDPADVQLVRDALSDDGLGQLMPFDNRQDFLAAVEQTPNLILADYKLPTFDGLEALSLCRTRCPEVPFIFLTGAMGDERAIETLKSERHGLRAEGTPLSPGGGRATVLAEAEDIAPQVCRGAAPCRKQTLPPRPPTSPRASSWRTSATNCARR